MSNKPNITPKAPSVKMAVQVMEMSDGAIKIDTDRPDREPWEIGNLLLGTVNLIYQGLKPEQKIVQRIQSVNLSDAAADRMRIGSV